MGFRPICPVIRGSAPPIIDAHVDLPSLQADKEGMPDNDAPLKPSAVIDAIAPDSDVDTSSSPDDETSDQSGQSECDDRLETFHAAACYIGCAIHLHSWCTLLLRVHQQTNYAPLSVTHLKPSRQLAVLRL